MPSSNSGPVKTDTEPARFRLSVALFSSIPVCPSTHPRVTRYFGMEELGSAGILIQV